MASPPKNIVTASAGLKKPGAPERRREVRPENSICKYGPAKASAATPKNGACRWLRHASAAVMASITRPGQFFRSARRQPDNTTNRTMKNRTR